jgi:hypothetical protein
MKNLIRIFCLSILLLTSYFATQAQVQNKRTHNSTVTQSHIGNTVARDYKYLPPSLRRSIQKKEEMRVEIAKNIGSQQLSTPCEETKTTISSNCSSSADVSEAWANYSNSRFDSVDNEAVAIARGTDGFIYVVGSGESETGYDYITIKYDANGVQYWVRRYDGPAHGDDHAVGIVADDLGNVYVTGSSVGNGTDYDYATIKYDSLGVEKWVKRYNGPRDSTDYAYGLSVDSNSNVFVTGTSFGDGTGFDYATIKYNTDGAQEWMKRYNGPGKW